MAVAAVQRVGKAATAASISIASGDGWAAPTAGNYILVTANSDATVTITNVGGTWTAGPSVVDGNGAYLWWKISNGAETTITFTPSVSDTITVTACEYSGVAAIGFDVSNSSTIAAVSGNQTSAASITTTADGDLVAAVALLHGTLGGTISPPTGPSWTNGFINVLSPGTGGSADSDTYTFYAEQVVGTAGSYSTVCTWTNNRANRQHIIIAFKAATGPQVVEVGTTTYLSANTATVTTASFTPASNCLLVAYCGMGNGTGGAISLGTVSDSLSGTWRRLAGDVLTNGGVAEIWSRDVGTAAAMTVTYDPGGTGASGNNIIVKQYVGAKPSASQPGATALNAGAAPYSLAIVTTKAGSVVAGALGRATSGVVLTANASTTILGQVNGSAGDTSGLFRATALTTTPGSTTLGFTNVGAVSNYIALAEILPADPELPNQPAPSLPPPLLFELVARTQLLWSTDAAAGTVFTQDLAGSVTPTGVLANAASKALAGAVTPTGAAAKAVTKPGLAGLMTPTGALVRQANKALAGSVTPTGALATVKVVLRSFAGSVTPTGTLTKQVGKALAGSSAATGTLTRQTAKALTGAVTATGALAKSITKAITGSVTPTGVLSSTRVILRAFAGAVTPTGVLTRQTNKALTGSSTPRGALARAMTKALAGAVTAVGALAKLVAKPFTGSSTPRGALTATNQGATQNATSAAAVAENRTSTPGVAANRTSTPGVTSTRSSSPTVSDG